MLEVLLINVIILLFPLVIDLFYFTYSTNLNREQSRTFLDFSLLSSFYLLMIHNNMDGYSDFTVMLNIPLIIAFVKKRDFVSVVISLAIIFVYYQMGTPSILILVSQYILYFVIYLVTIKRNKSVDCLLTLFVTVKSIFLILNFIIERQYTVLNFLNVLLTLIIFVSITYLVLYMFKKGEDIIKLHMTVKELEKEKQIRDSLFKITHEIKNPIAVCKSYLDMFDMNNKDHARYIPIVREEIQKVLLLLQDFLCMNKIKIQKELLDINFLLEDIINQFDPVLTDKKIRFVHDVEFDEIFVDGDYNRLSQVLTNIIKNSLEAVDENKESYISINTFIEDKKFYIVVEDNGIGIAEENIKQIKEPFFTTKKNGTGLGVSLSYEIIEAHNGTIEYHSKLYEGTKVMIALPLSTMFN